ncbi:methylated-DNA-[protein]-cysteine S-methyltransferase [Sedimentibacter acidaminivorans]|uniref:Methylated-DNA--protein-cysteine methyltransferase n=2 Tax=Sedimentibacter acidaminivorans TaxID=913099 RepID=A0ABS4GHF6_9FIRM|nr:methylated-DNA--[protein]-cysteine S-methyltransferase [Sedimentibacter acidaminivorans]MBP1927130.1 methylated-DNA-[protein]-cysteine S-methyltransferase [Sedimentibacter acidaminivorans]
MMFFYDTTIGKIGISENGKAVTNIYFENESLENKVQLVETPLIKNAFEQIKEYLNGKRKTFDFPIELNGTEFQKSVWRALQEIPYGETKTYKEIAIAIGNEKACRAVGMANNKNPLPIVIPCHRVIGANGKLVGYAGGLNIKENLIKIENKLKE